MTLLYRKKSMTKRLIVDLKKGYYERDLQGTKRENQWNEHISPVISRENEATVSAHAWEPKPDDLFWKRAEPRAESVCPFEQVSLERRRLQRRHRLNNAADFRRIFKTSRRYRDTHFYILVDKNGRPYPRLGLIIAKKTVRRAVKRNRVKRVIRESFRSHAHRLTGLDIVVMAQKNIDTNGNRLMQQSLATHWERIIRQCAR